MSRSHVITYKKTFLEGVQKQSFSIINIKVGKLLEDNKDKIYFLYNVPKKAVQSKCCHCNHFKMTLNKI